MPEQPSQPRYDGMNLVTIPAMQQVENKARDSNASKDACENESNELPIQNMLTTVQDRIKVQTNLAISEWEGNYPWNEYFYRPDYCNRFQISGEWIQTGKRQNELLRSGCRLGLRNITWRRSHRAKPDKWDLQISIIGNKTDLTLRTWRIVEYPSPLQISTDCSTLETVSKFKGIIV